MVVAANGHGPPVKASFFMEMIQVMTKGGYAVLSMGMVMAAGILKVLPKMFMVVFDLAERADTLKVTWNAIVTIYSGARPKEWRPVFPANPNEVIVLPSSRPAARSRR